MKLINDNILGYELSTLTNYFDADYSTTHQLINGLFHRFSLNMGPTSLPYWIDQYSDNKQANRMLLKLVQDGIVNTTVAHNYSQIEINRDFLLKDRTAQELADLITVAKLEKYSPLGDENITTSPEALKVKLQSGIKASGLARFGLAEAGMNEFQYDTEMMSKYRDEIVAFSVLAMKKMEKKLHRSLRLPEGYDYQSIIGKVIDQIIQNQGESYILGNLVLDSRGRAIYQCLRTIFNPLGNKIARGLVMSPPTKIVGDGRINAYMFISELLDGFNPDPRKKATAGFKAYNQRRVLDIDTSTEEGLKDLFENIWLERLYADLDALKLDPNHLVTTPIEVDFKASNMTVIGLLLGHQEYVDSTKYMWKIDGLTKLHVKFAQTPYVFGSSASPKVLWKKNNVEYTDEQVKIIRKEQVNGKFSIANRLKDIIIKESRPTEIMELHVGQERFTVECNKTKNVAETTKQYIVIDSTTQQFKVIHHTNTHKVPDLDQFKRYFMTGLIHNADSQILDNICLNMDWILPNHDAGIVTWDGATRMRDLAVREMRDVQTHGDEIVSNYLESINLTPKGWKQYAKLKHDIAKLNPSDEFTISPYLLS